MRREKKRKPQIGGFTLVELIIVMALFGILLAIAIPNLVRFRQSSAAYQAARGLAADVELTRNLSLSIESEAKMTFPSTSMYEIYYYLYQPGNDTPNEYMHKRVDLGKNFGSGIIVSGSPSGDVKFGAMGFISADKELTIQNGTIAYKVKVERNGKCSVTE